MKSSRIKPIGSTKAAQETLALLQILMLGRRQAEQGKTVPAGEVFHRLRKRRLLAG